MFSVLVDLINAPNDAVSKAKAQGHRGSVFSTLLDAVLFVYTIGFWFFRIGELVPLQLMFPLQVKTVIIGSLSLRLLWQNRLMGQLVHVVTLLGLIYACDVLVPQPLPSPNEIYASKTVFITGANSGVGFETARQLVVDYGMNVMLGCRNTAKCKAAADAINAEASSGLASPLLIDLSNFDSVKQAADQLREQKIDVLYNNAGHTPDPKLPVNEYGLESSFTSMHLSHYLLTELLLEINPKLRVVNTSSGTHHLCALPFTYLPEKLLNFVEWSPGCVDEEFLLVGMRSPTDSAAYFRAKIANMMHAVSIPHNHPHATSVAIDLGWVGTSIQPFMELSISPTSLGWMRNTQMGVLPSMHAILTSDEELFVGLKKDRHWSDGGVVMNTLGFTEEAYSLPFWEDGANANVSRDRMLELGRKLWVTSLRTIKSIN